MTTAVRRVLVAGSIIATVANVPFSLQAQSDAAGRFQRAPIAGRIQSTFLPRSISRPPVIVVVVLAGQSVADVQGAAGRRLTRQEKDAIKLQRRAEQAGIEGAVRASGGEVLGNFQSALNGIKVRIAADRVEQLRSLSGVVDVKPVGLYTHANVIGVPRIQAPVAWSGVNGVRGEGIKIAIVDTGIDYTHANFGGPGTMTAYQAAFLSDTQPADPSMFGPNAPKVKGGIDLVGDGYDASNHNANIPQPDPNQLDCGGHGSHVAGTAAGFGVVSNGTTYGGSYDSSTHTNNTFLIGPGVAPKADLYAVRAFGCAGKSAVIIDAIDWAVDNDMDVINLSLGAPFGRGDSADALAADNAVQAGITVVAGAGNDGNIPYIVGTPGVGRRGITVAAVVNPAFIFTANLSLPPVLGFGAQTIQAINANAVLQFSGTLTVKVLRTGSAVSLGCDPMEYVNQGVTGKLVVVQRGICARVARAIFGQQAGAAAVVMINNTSDLPPFEGQITQNPDTGEKFVVTIPFFGARGLLSNPNSDGSKLVARDGVSISISSGTPIQTGTSTFSSSGPRMTDDLLKPDISAPGEAVTSTLVASGNQGVVMSGTSMATPFVSGTAALVIQAHPSWTPAAVKSAIINSATPETGHDYATRRLGAGVVDAAAAVRTQAYAFANVDETTINFGLQEFGKDLSLARMVTVKNDGQTPVTFDVAAGNQQGSPHSINLGSSSMTVPPHGMRTLNLSLELPAATAGDSLDFREAAGVITFTPTGSSNNGYALHVPYYIVPRVSANVTTSLKKLKGSPPSGDATVQNPKSPIAATAEFYAWGLESPNEKNLGHVDLRAVGVESLDLV